MGTFDLIDPILAGNTGKNAYDQGVPYVLKKYGVYYAHNSRGYVSQVLLAELYSEDYAKNHARQCDECQAIPITELLTGPDEVQEYIDRMECMRDIMAQALE